MSVEPIFERINYQNKIFEKKEQIKSDCRTEIFSESVKNVLNVSAFAVVNDCTITNGRAEYSGKIIYFVSYLTEDGLLKKTECGNEFSGVIKDSAIEEGMLGRIYSNVEKVEADVSGVKLSVSAYVNICLETKRTEQFSALSGGENLISNKKEIPFVKSFGTKEAIYPLEEEFELDYPVEEVLSHWANAVITSVQCGVGSIIVDGEVILSAIMLQKTEKRDIIRENKCLPFRMEIECDDAMPTMTATARVSEKSFKTDVITDEQNAKSIVNVSITLKFEGEAFANSQITVATDAFSLDEEIELEKGELSLNKNCDLRHTTSIISGRVALEELPVSTTLYAIGGEKVEITSKNFDQTGINLVGVLTAVGYFKDEDKYFTRKLEMPFEKRIDSGFSEEVSLEIIVKPQRAKGKIITLTEMEMECELGVIIYPTECERIQLVKGIKTVGEKKKCQSALSVYIAMEGEDLWSLSKRLNICPDRLIEINKELCFPLTGKERIVVYRQS